MWWSEWWDANRGEPAKGSQRKLAGILKEFGIHSDTIRFSSPKPNKKGYKREWFTDAFARYVGTPENRVTSVDALHDGAPTNGHATDVTGVTLFPEGGQQTSA
jgi:hypothetical protein